MRAALLCLLAIVALAAAEYAEEPWVEEEDVEDNYDEESESESQSYSRRRRQAYVEDPYEEHIRIKRCDDEPVYRVRRSPEYVRVPRQVHQYEVHEYTEDAEPSSPPYEEMLAASANHYQRYAAPERASARYLSPEVSVPEGVLSPVASHPVHFSVPNPFNQKLVAAPAFDDNIEVVAPPNVNPKSVLNNRVHFVAPQKAALNNPVQFVAPNAVNVAPGPVAPFPAAVGPIPVAVGPVPLKQLSDGDLLGSAAGHHSKHHHGHEAGGGHHHHGGHHGEHGHKHTEGFSGDHYVDKGAKGFKTDHLHRKEYEEAAGKKKKHHDEAGHKGSHEEAAHGARGAKFDEKKGHKKGHKTKGYHNKYHKDEFHKEHKFYDDFHKSGEHHRYGKFNAKHASNESGKKKAHHVNAGHDFVERGKKGYSNKGHMDADHKGHNSKHGHDEHHEHHAHHGKKGGKDGGSHWGYAKKQ